MCSLTCCLFTTLWSVNERTCVVCHVVCSPLDEGLGTIHLTIMKLKPCQQYANCPLYRRIPSNGKWEKRQRCYYSILYTCMYMKLEIVIYISVGIHWSHKKTQNFLSLIKSLLRLYQRSILQMRMCILQST